MMSAWREYFISIALAFPLFRFCAGAMPHGLRYWWNLRWENADTALLVMTMVSAFVVMKINNRCKGACYDLFYNIHAYAFGNLFYCRTHSEASASTSKGIRVATKSNSNMITILTAVLMRPIIKLIAPLYGLSHLRKNG